MRYRKRPFLRESGPLWLGEMSNVPAMKFGFRRFPTGDFQVANCHEEAQALREYLAEVRKFDAGNHPKVETFAQTFRGGNLECGPRLSKNGKLCHYFEHRSLWRIMFCLNSYFNCIFLISFEIWWGLKHNQLLVYWDFPHGHWQSIGSNVHLGL